MIKFQTKTPNVGDIDININKAVYGSGYQSKQYLRKPKTTMPLIHYQQTFQQ